jgi:hypothetical protein
MRRLFDKVIIFLVLLMCVQLCSAQYCADCPIRKKKYRFGLEKKANKPSHVAVRTDGIYIYKGFSETSKKWFYGYRIYFANGRMFRSCTYCDSLDFKDVCNFSMGYCGHYIIRDSLLLQETFTPYSRYTINYAHIKDDTLIFYAYQGAWWRKIPYEEYEVYFYPMEITCTPDW